MTKKVKTIILSSICALLAVGIALSITFLVLYTKKLDTPKNLEIVDSLPDDKILIQADKVDGAEKYCYEISFGKNVKVLYSENNFMEVSEYLQNYGRYTFRCRVFGKTNAATSAYSGLTTYTVVEKLSAPEVMLDGDKLVFTEVENATDYSLIYGVDSRGELLKMSGAQLVAESGKRYFDLSRLGAGEYSLTVIATGAGYSNSNMSNRVTYERVIKYSIPSGITFNEASRVLIFTSKASSFKLVVYGDQHLSGKEIFVNSDGTHVINLSDHVEGTITKIEITALGSELSHTISSDIGVWRK